MIRVLPKNVADKIAAGEVVDRPASIVKELLENAIDSGADTITVEIRNGGKTYIRVADNGCGIPKDEVSTAFLRHATSKVQTADDLFQIRTLGFRGEALASIAAVSRTEMITKPAAEHAGVSVRIEGGEITSITDTGCPDGTTIVVSDLFYNTPARLKFMKADATESTQVISLVSRMALAYPRIKIRMISNGSVLFYTSGKGNIHADIINIFGKETGEKLIRYAAGEGDTGQVDIEVFVSPQDQTRVNRKNQVFFVNGRHVTSRLIENAITEAYKGRIPEGRFPIVFLFYRINPSEIDVNIHPNKKEVRFSDEKKVYQFITSTLTRALNSVNIMPDIKITEPSQEATSDQPSPAGEPEEKPQLDIPAFFAQKRKEQEKINQEQEKIKQEPENKVDCPAEMQIEYQDYIAPPAKFKEDKESYEPHISAHPEIAGIQISGSIFHTYIIGYDTNYFYLIDQHAAHERVFYEHFLEQLDSETKAQQSVMDPIILEVPTIDTEKEEPLIEYLQKCGFQIMPFGPKLYKVSSIPFYMSIGGAGDFLRDFIDQMGDNISFTDQKRIEKIIMNACKKAVKANDHLSLSEMKHLLSDLSKTTNPFSCPHGRPVFIKLGKQEIEKMFRRI